MSRRRRVSPEALSLLVVPWLFVLSGPAAAGHRLHRPVVYLLDYGRNHPADPAFVPRAAAHPPHVLHLPHDTVIDNTWGAAYAGRRPWVPAAKEGSGGCLAPAELEEIAGRLRAMTAALRAGGCEIVAPYICNQTLAGDPERRTGIWAFYDRWEEYRELGFGPRPPADPRDWLAREPGGRLHFNYETRHAYFARYGERRFAPCANNPHYNRYLEGVVRWIARTGMNGVFVDNCILNCYCEHCARAFRAHLEASYSPEERARRFGTSDAERLGLAERGNKIRFVLRDPRFRRFLETQVSAEKLRAFYGSEKLEQALLEEGGNGFLWTRAGEYLEHRRRTDCGLEPPAGDTAAWASRRPTPDWGIESPAERALWAETQLFWALSVRRSLERIRSWGSGEGGPFHVIPNWGAMQTIQGHEFRQEIGHDVAVWAPASDWIFFEEDTNPGRIAPGLYLDFALQHRYALAAGRPAVVMNYGRTAAPFTELSMAEGLACGSGHVKITWEDAELHDRYRRFGDAFFQAYEGAVTHARVALLLSYRQVRMRHRSHLDELYEWVRYLGAQQILYDVVLEKHLTPEGLSGYGALVLPQARYLSGAELEALRRFRDRGGVLVLTGEPGRADEAARPRAALPAADLLGEGAGEPIAGVRVSGDRKGIHAAAMAFLVPQREVPRDGIWSAGRSQALLERLGWKGGAAPYRLMALADEIAPAHRYEQGGWLARHLERVAPEVWHPVADPCAAAGLRLCAFRLEGPAGRRLAVNIVNYNLSLGSEETPRFEAVEAVDLRIPLPPGWEMESAVLRVPGEEERPLELSQSGGVLRVMVPRVRVLAQIDAGARPRG